MEVISEVLSENSPIILNSVIIFIVILVITRIAGLRTFAKMSPVDFASTIAIGSILATTILSSKTSLINGTFALMTIVFLQIAYGRLMKNFSAFHKLASNKPLFLMRNGIILKENLDRSGVSMEDLMAKLREANAIKLSNVKAVVFETTGDIAVLHGEGSEDVDDSILIGIEDLKEASVATII